MIVCIRKQHLAVLCESNVNSSRFFFLLPPFHSSLPFSFPLSFSLPPCELRLIAFEPPRVLDHIQRYITRSHDMNLSNDPQLIN